MFQLNRVQIYDYFLFSRHFKEEITETQASKTDFENTQPVWGQHFLLNFSISYQL